MSRGAPSTVLTFAMKFEFVVELSSIYIYIHTSPGHVESPKPKETPFCLLLRPPSHSPYRLSNIALLTLTIGTQNQEIQSMLNKQSSNQDETRTKNH